MNDTIGTELVAGFVGAVIDAMPDAIGAWDTIYNGPDYRPDHGLIILPFYWHDASKQLAVHIMANADTLAGCGDIPGLAKSMVEGAIERAKSDDFFSAAPNFYSDGTLYAQSGSKLSDTRTGAAPLRH